MDGTFILIIVWAIVLSRLFFFYSPTRPVRVRRVGIRDYVATDADRARGYVLAQMDRPVARRRVVIQRHAGGSERNVGRARVLPQGTVSFYLWLYLSFFFICTRAISMTSCFVHLFTGICWTEPNTLLPTAACPLT